MISAKISNKILPDEKLKKKEGSQFSKHRLNKYISGTRPMLHGTAAKEAYCTL